MSTSDVISLHVQDVHLSHKVPAVRDCSLDEWYAVQAGYLDQLTALHKQHNAPVVIAGDLFDRWNPPPSLVNMAMRHLPERVFAVPGQHDMRFHQISDMHHTGFGTLVESGKVIMLKPGEPLRFHKRRLELHGFPWGEDVKPLDARSYNDGWTRVAVIHAYVWVKDEQRYPGARDSQKASAYKDRMVGYDLVHFGDNHKPFEVGKIYNGGAFMVRKSDEMDQHPKVGILTKTGMKPHHLDVSGDRFVSKELIQVMGEDLFTLNEFIDGLKDVRDAVYDFRDRLHRFMESGGVTDEVRREVMKALEGKQ
jgi:DNA repair exonuclease SbcCD nuclease subunit